jgi:hypothetical protein
MISTSLDGTMNVVGDVMPMSKAKAELRAFTGEEFKKVELFDLRQPAKRRKLNRAAAPEQPALPSFDEIAQKLASGEVVLPEDGFGKNDVPHVKTLEKAFDVSIDAKARNDIWAKVQELKTAGDDSDAPDDEDPPPEE